MDREEFAGLSSEVYRNNKELVALLDALLAADGPPDAFGCLLLSRYMNLKGDPERAEEFIHQAFEVDPQLLSKLLPPENPNLNDTLQSEYEMVNVDSCPVCAATERTSLHTGLVVEHVCYHVGLSPALHWVQCDKCTHVYARAQNRSDALFEGPPRSTEHAFDVGSQRYASDYESIAHLPDLRPNGLALEIGVGNGTRLAAMRDMGLDAHGIEIQASIAERCKQMGLPVTREDFHDHNAPENSQGYDIIVLGDVIEHLPELRKSVKKIASLLAPDGLLWISTPQYDNFITKQLRKLGTDPFLVELEHWHYFTRASVIALMKAHGLKLTRQRYGKTFIAAIEYTFQRVAG